MNPNEIHALRMLFAHNGVCADDMHDGDVDGIATSMRSVLTGSQVYGHPNPASDIDLVILVDQWTAKYLWDMGEEEKASTPRSVRFGQLNLIIETSPAKFAAWKQGTEYLESISPVTRDVAVAHFKKLFSGCETVPQPELVKQ